MANAEQWGGIAAALMPSGLFWQGYHAYDGTGRALLNAKGETLAAVEASANRLLSETRPSSTVQMIEAHKYEWGFPDKCTFPDMTLQEWKLAIVAKKRNRGGQSIPYFTKLAADMGYPVEIKRHRPFTCGSHKSRCGRDSLAGPEVRCCWTVRVKGRRITKFRTGGSLCGEKLGTIRRAYDLECVLHRAAPTWGVLFVHYED